MRRFSWRRSWKHWLLWIHVAGIVGCYAYSWWHAPFIKKDRAHIKKLIAKKAVVSEINKPCPKVSIIVPARNEEDNIRRCLLSLFEQNFTNYEIIVVNDDSTDNTSSILEEIASDPLYRDLLQVLHLQNLPEEWFGKPHAIHMGTQKARGEWLLFTDADTWHKPDALRVALALAEEEQVDLLTLGPTQELLTPWERILMPMAYLSVSIRFPIRLVNNPDSGVVSANGQYILIRRQVYEAIGGYNRPDLRKSVIDDIALGGVVKKSGFRLRFVDGRDLIHVRMYGGLKESWQGWVKNAFLANRGGLASVLQELFELPAVAIFPFLLPLLAFIPGKRRSMQVYIAAIIELVTLLTYRIWLNKMLHIRWYYAFTHFLGGVIFEGILVQSTWNILSGKGLKWRNRHYRNVKS